MTTALDVKYSKWNLKSGNGELIALITSPAERVVENTVIIPPGYGHQIYHYASLSRGLNLSGFRTVRFDFKNHVGRSTGEIRYLTMDSMAEDIEAAYSAVAARDDVPPLLLGVSLAARAAVRCAADGPGAGTPGPAGLVLLLPTVDVQYTVDQASEVGIVSQWVNGEATDPHSTCKVVRHDVELEFCRSAMAGGWLGTDSTRAEIARTACPVVAICAEQDDWVRPADVESAMEAKSSWSREVVVIEATSHDVFYNPPVARLMLEMIVNRMRAMTGAPTGEVRHPEFDDVVQTVETERRWAHQDYADVPGYTAAD